MKYRMSSAQMMKLVVLKQPIEAITKNFLKTIKATIRSVQSSDPIFL